MTVKLRGSDSIVKMLEDIFRSEVKPNLINIIQGKYNKKCYLPIKMTESESAGKEAGEMMKMSRESDVVSAVSQHSYSPTP